MRPVGRIADRSLSDTPIVRDFPAPPAILISSGRVSTSMRRGDDPTCGCPFTNAPPTSFVDLSDTLVTAAFSSRSYQSLPMIPLTDGVAPDRIVLCPTAVIVGTWM